MARLITGIVTSDKADKTIVVTTTTRQTHPLYKKQYSVSKKIMAHDEKNEAKIGDKVVIAESRPLSAHKRFSLKKIVDKAHAGFVEADAIADVPQDQKSDTGNQKSEKSTEPAEQKVDESKGAKK